MSKRGKELSVNSDIESFTCVTSHICNLRTIGLILQNVTKLHVRKVASILGNNAVLN